VFLKNQSIKYWPTHPLEPVINKFLIAKI